MEEKRRCIKCKQSKPIQNFGFITKKHDYRKRTCNACFSLYYKKVRADRRAKGLCPDCGKPASAGYKLCAKCREHMARRARERWARVKEGNGGHEKETASVTPPAAPPSKSQSFDSDELREDTRKIRDNFLLKVDKEEETAIKLAIQKGLRGKEARAIVSVWKEERAEIA